ncbi:MAG: DUF1328 domain-containing protein [Nitrospiraceae bacterium]
MITLEVILFVLVIVAAVYGFGIVSSPYLEAFRFAFYLFLLIFVVAVAAGLIQETYHGYDPTPEHPR